MAITKELAIASIIITPATGAVRVEQVQRVLEDGHELASRMAELAADLPAQDTTTPRTPSVLERAGGTKGK